MCILTCALLTLVQLDINLHISGTVLCKIFKMYTFTIVLLSNIISKKNLIFDLYLPPLS